MPIYEYECTKCGAKFELRRGLNESDDNIKCPKCGTEHPKRIFSLFSTASASGASASSCAPSSST